MKFKAYPKIPAFGYDGTDDILDGNVVITPKIDGSNVAVWLGEGQVLKARRNGWLNHDNGSFSTFERFVDEQWLQNVAMKSMADRDNYLVIFGEFSNNQNKLKYNEKYPIIVFDVAETFVDEDGEMHFDFKGYEYTKGVADDLFWPVVPALYVGHGSELINGSTIVADFLGRESVLGGPIEEGVVVKSYDRRTRYGRNYFCKLVTAEFREKQNVSMKATRVGTGIGEWAAETFLTPARLRKAIQRMQEEGTWDTSAAKKNIGKLIGVVTKDIYDEHYTEIAEKAANVAWKESGTMIAKGVAPLLDEIMMEESNG